MPASGAGSRLCREAIRSSYRSTRGGFSVGGGRRKKQPLSDAQKAQLAHLRRLAPKPKKKRRI